VWQNFCIDGICPVPIITGTCGTGLTWSYDVVATTLTISGSGNMDTYTATNQPWHAFRSKVRNIVTSEGVAHIGNNAFNGCTGLTTFTNHRSTPQTIAVNVFEGVNISAATLYVPNGSINAYNGTAVWTNFGNTLPISHITITTQPATTTNVIAGNISSNLTIVANATQGATPTYQWYSNTTASSLGGAEIAGATGTSFAVPTTLMAGTYYYFAEVRAAGATPVRSNVATVNVAGITITNQPETITNVTENNISGSLTVTANTTTGVTLTYQWFSNTENSNVGGIAITGATNASFTIPTTLAKGMHYFFCEVRATGTTSVRSDVATINVTPSLPFYEDFESDHSLWTFVNGSQPNQWVIGSATAASGTRSAYISNDGGISNAYNINQSNVTHLFLDVAFPETTEPFTLSFDWKGMGQWSGTPPNQTVTDYLEAFWVDPSVTPVAGSRLPSANTAAFFRSANQSTWRTVTQSLPTSFAGTTRRLVFTWVNDNWTGTQPPAAIDNIKIAIQSVITITTQPAVSTNVTVGNITGSLTVQANVTQGATLNYQWYSNTTNSTTGGTVISGATNASFTIPTDLMAGTHYFFCEISAEGAFSLRSDVATVSVLCASITSFPFTESFEGTTFPPECWVRFDIDGGGSQWARNTTFSRTGSASAGHIFSNAGMQEGWLVTPPLSIPATGSYALMFWSYSDYPNFHHYSGVWVSTEGSNPSSSTFVELKQLSGSEISNQWKKITIHLNAYAGQTIFIGFKYMGNNADDWYIDDVEVSLITGDITHAQTPNITTHPQGATYPQNATATPLSATYSIADGGTVTYQWFRNTTGSNSGGTAISGATNRHYTPPTTTVGTMHYYVVKTNTNNSVNGNRTAIATSNTAAIVVTETGTSIVEIEADNMLKIYPNPFSDEIHIVNAEIGSTLYILNTNGLLVHTQRIASPTETIRLGHLPKGAYVLRIGEQSVRIVKN